MYLWIEEPVDDGLQVNPETLLEKTLQFRQNSSKCVAHLSLVVGFRFHRLIDIADTLLRQFLDYLVLQASIVYPTEHAASHLFHKSLDTALSRDP